MVGIEWSVRLGNPHCRLAQVTLRYPALKHVSDGALQMGPGWRHEGVSAQRRRCVYHVLEALCDGCIKSTNPGPFHACRS